MSQVKFEEGFEEDPAKLRVAEYFRTCIQGLEEDGKLWIGGVFFLNCMGGSRK